MPSIRKKPFAASDIVTCLHAGGMWIQLPGEPARLICHLARLRGDDPVVKADPGSFAIFTTDDEYRHARAAMIAERYSLPAKTVAELVRVPPPAPLTAAESVVLGEASIAGIKAGEWVDRKAAVVKANRGSFVPVLPAGHKPEDCYIANATLRHTRGDESTAVVYAGQMTARDHELVSLHPHAFDVPRIA